MSQHKYATNSIWDIFIPKIVSFYLKFRFHQAFSIWPDKPILCQDTIPCVHPRDMQPNMFLLLNINLMIL